MRMKKLIFNLIMSILVTSILFSFVACGGGGSSGGDDDVTPTVTPVVVTDPDGSVQVKSPSYAGLTVTLKVQGATFSGGKLRAISGQAVVLTVQEDYESYAWTMNNRSITTGTLQENGKVYTFTPDTAGSYGFMV